MKLEIKRPYGIINNKQIDEFENKYDIRLPNDYKDFLQKTNGGYVSSKGESPNDYIYDFKNCVGDDLGLYVEKFNSIDDLAFEVKYEPELNRPDLIYIARCGGGHHLSISISENDYGKIFFYEYGIELNEALSVIANSFDEFMSNFKYEKR